MRKYLSPECPKSDPRSGYRVTYFYDPKRTFDMDRQLCECLRVPPPGPKGMKLPHHLDSHHAKVFTDLPKGSLVLEVGCGGGQMRSWIRDLGLKYWGTDVSFTRVSDTLRAHGGPNIVGDAHFLPVKDNSVDVVYATAVTEHLACPVLAFQNVLRVLKPGGSFIGKCSFLETWHDYSYFHMTPLGVIEVLKEADFEIECVWPEKGWTMFNSSVRMAFRGPFKVVLPIAVILSQLYRLQSRIRVLMHWLKRTKCEHRLMDEARVAGAIGFIARKPKEIAKIGPGQSSDPLVSCRG